MQQMMHTASRYFWMGVLVLFALLWTFLMSMGAGSTTPNVAGAFVAGSGSQAGEGAHLMYVDESRFPQVTAYFAVNDEQGQPLLGLAQEDFTLKEDGVTVPIVEFVGGGGQAATVMLVIDRSGSMNGDKIVAAQNAALTFVDRLVPGQDRVGVLIFDHRWALLAPLDVLTEQGKRQLQQAIVDHVYPDGGTGLYEAILAGLEQAAPLSGRKVLLVMTDGRADNNWNQSNAIKMAQEARTPLYVIGLGWDVDERALQYIADQTGGVYYFSPSASELESLYQEIGSGLRSEYALTYESLTPNLDGTRRAIEAQIALAGGEIEAEGSYAVGGILASSLNLALFLPLLIVLGLGLVGLYGYPEWRRRRREAQAEKASSEMGSGEGAAGGANGDRKQGTVVATPALKSQEKVSVQTAAIPAQAIPIQAVQGAPLQSVTVVMPAVALIRERPILATPLLIGSGADATLRLNNSSVRPHHARLIVSNGRYVLEDLSSGGSAVSFTGDPTQLRPVERNAVRDGSLIQVGSSLLVFRQPPVGAPWLEEQIAIGAEGAIIGSASGSAVCVEDASPQQARLRREGPRWIVESLSNSPFFVSFGGDPSQEMVVNGRNALKNGSRLRVGATTLRFRSVE